MLGIPLWLIATVLWTTRVDATKRRIGYPYLVACAAAHGGVAQSAEQAAHNRCVTGSSPVSATRRGSVFGGLRPPSRCLAAFVLGGRPPRPPMSGFARRLGGSGNLCCPTYFHVVERHSIVAATDVRPKITLACQECKHRNYITKKNRRNDPDRLELKKFCPNCRRHTEHRETR